MLLWFIVWIVGHISTDQTLTKHRGCLRQPWFARRQAQRTSRISRESTCRNRSNVRFANLDHHQDSWEFGEWLCGPFPNGTQSLAAKRKQKTQAGSRTQRL